MASDLQLSAAASIAAKVPESTINSAVTALFKYKAAAATSTDKLQLLPQDDYIYLNLTLTNIPPKARTNPFKIPLSHPLFDDPEIALIIDDRPKSPTPPSDLIKKLIKSQNIPISKVIKISKLKTDYKPFEAKRKLCDSYDIFLVDKRVVHLLPKLIGKEFFKKKKLPLGVDLSKKNLKLQVERALGSALLYLRTGTCCVMKVGKVAMEKDEVVENVFDAINGAVERLPMKWAGVRSLHLKFHDSLALPLYQAMPDVKLKIDEVKEKEMGDEVIVAKISDGEGEDKKSARKVGKSKKKGRIHEVRYMDVGEGIESDDGNVDENDQIVGQKGNLMEEVDDDDEDDKDESEKIENEDLSVSAGKKRRNKSKASKVEVLEVANEEKRVKKKAKSEKSEGVKVKTDGVLKKGKRKSGDNVDENEFVGQKGNLAEDISIKGNVGKKRNKAKALKEDDLGASKEEKRVKKKVKFEKNDSEKLEENLASSKEDKKVKKKVKSEKNGLSKEKRKSEVPIEKIAKHKKKASAK